MLGSALWFGGAAWAANARPIAASSEAVSTEGVAHRASSAFDGLFTTGWAEGDTGDGAGAWIEVRFAQPIDVASVSLFPGWLGGSDREIREYGRPKLVTLSIETAGEPVVKQERLLDPGESGPLRHDVRIDAPQAKALRVTIDEAFPGGLVSDTFIAEIAVNLIAGTPAPAVGEVVSWLDSDAGKAASASQRDAAIALFDKIHAEQFGDSDSLDQLMAWAADGAPYLRDRVTNKVPAAFRVNALQPDKTSIEALLKLRDSNAIPAIERAALRVAGPLAADLRRRAKLFDAYQELRGGGGRNIKPWGQEGFAKGALRSLGTPLDVVVDGYGGLYVADTGNNRVQRFSVDTGVVEKVWGAAEPAVTDVWFTGTRDGYASGAAPGEGDGEFVNPVDLALVPGKDGDGLLVLDARGRVTHIDAAGNVAHVQKMTYEMGVSSAEGHLVLVGKSKVAVVFGNIGAVYDLRDWSELGAFELKEGPPSGAVALPGNKLGLVYGQHLIGYSLDGFRHGDLLGDSLGGGFQDWSVTLDEKGKLWAVLDTGSVVKFKKPGKVDFAVTIGEYSLQTPRIAVYQDLVFVTESDRILHADALELLAKAESGESGSGLLETGEELE
ncbi:MAG: hypothetical protein ABMA64_11530 [Myxococcota bacterium]